MGTAARLAEHDPGVGDKGFRNILRGMLFPKGSPRKNLRHSGLDYAALKQMGETIDNHYLGRWADALGGANPPGAERAARAIASHLLDSGFFPDFLHRWWTFKLRHEAGEKALSDIVREADALAGKVEKTFRVLVTFPSALQASARGLKPPSNWLTGEQTSGWLSKHQFESRDIKQQGGLLLEVVAREPEAAVQLALEKIELFAARVLVTLRKQVSPIPYAWVEGEKRYALSRRVRGLKIGAMERENRVWLESEPDGVIDPALELLGPLQLGSSSAAIAGGWAAIEALLSEPGNRGEVSDRLACIVACSFPRSELTELSYVIEKDGGALADQLERLTVNRDRCGIVAQAILDRSVPTLPNPSDNAAIERMRALLRDPHAQLNDIQAHLKDSLARWYRQRNLVLHAGLTNAVALAATLRTATPLIGAGVDRIAHFRYIGRVNPIELAARARLALATVSPLRPLECIDLLGA